MRMTPARRTLVAVLGAAAVLGGSAVPASALPLPVPGTEPTGTPTPTPTGTASPTTTPTGTPTPSGSATPSGTPSPTATCPTVQLGPLPCLTPPPPTSSASPTATTSASASPTPSGPARPTVAVNPSTIVAVQQSATVAGTAAPGSTVELYAYSRPSTTYRLVRTADVGEDGRYSFQVGPSGNTRLYVRTVTPEGSSDSDSLVLTVRTSLNLKVARTGTRAYRFTGSLLPKRPGQLVTVFYEKADGGRVIVGRARNAADGTYRLDRAFSGGGTFTFFTGTGTDINNASNSSNLVRATVR